MYDSSGREIHLGDIVVYSDSYGISFGRVVNMSETRVHINSHRKYCWNNFLIHDYYKSYITPARLLVLDGIDNNEQILGKLATHSHFYGSETEVLNQTT